MELYEVGVSSVKGDLKVKLGVMCVDENDIEELHEVYGLFCWQPRFWRLQKTLVVQHHDGVQLQGIFNVVS